MREPRHHPGVGFLRLETRPAGQYPRSTARFLVPPFGWLEGFEVWLRDPLPNMDASSYVELEARLHVNGQVIDVERVVARVRTTEIDAP